MDWKKLLPLAGIIILIYILWRFNVEKILTVFTTIDPFYAVLCFLGIPLIFKHRQLPTVPIRRPTSEPASGNPLLGQEREERLRVAAARLG